MKKWTLRTDFGDYAISFTADERNVIKAGSEALNLLQQTRTRSWELWVVVGTALLLLRDKVQRATGSPRPIGKTYNSVLSELLSRFDLVMDGATRTRLFDLLEHRLEVEWWRNALTPDRARTFTHPNSVWRAWKASQQQRSEEPTQNEK
jgi:hypothetical protein